MDNDKPENSDQIILKPKIDGQTMILWVNENVDKISHSPISLLSTTVQMQLLKVLLEHSDEFVAKQVIKQYLTDYPEV